ncbi:MAG TPA: MarR family transcriptional regulator [Candidatus Saccharimonadales bacterium]|nr:MarR family transcriptional regulator [Candidatus Saccharimonadales bacterium]
MNWTIDLANLGSAMLILAAIVTAVMAFRGFKQSKQAIVESASLITVIVGALTSRIETSEDLVAQLRSDFDSINARQTKFEETNTSSQTEYVHLLGYVQELLTYDKRFVTELTELKKRLISLPQTRSDHGLRRELVLGAGNIMENLTPTEHQVMEILGNEGAKAAPELGKRLNKSREHMARLMKKLYLEGYVDRESNHTPFRYKLSEKLRSTIQVDQQTTSAASEKI